MCYIRYIHLLLLLLVFLEVTNSQRNNVCPSYLDYFSMQTNKNCWYNFAADLKVPDIIKNTGYPFQEYKTRTSDGYILTLFRIPNVNSKKSPVFLLHGMQCTSGIFVGLGRDSLAFTLADAGYDVWLGNYRGSEYSQEHVSLNASMSDYWDFGVDEIGLIDVPYMMELVRYHTQNKGKIVYIGHSLGTTAGIIYASEYPDHAKQLIKLFIWLSPAYKLNNMMTPFRFLLPIVRPLLRLTNNLNLAQVFSNRNLQNFSKSFCLSSPGMMLLCLNALNLFTGPFAQIAPETVPVVFNHFPGGTSLKTLIYLQDATRGRFGKFDYGGKNFFMYGNSTAPEYNISKIQVPVFIFCARHDWATTRRDSLSLFRQLPKEVQYGTFEVRNSFFNHFDFIFGRNAKTLVYNRLVKVIEGFKETPMENNNAFMERRVMIENGPISQNEEIVQNDAIVENGAVPANGAVSANGAIVVNDVNIENFTFE